MPDKKIKVLDPKGIEYPVTVKVEYPEYTCGLEHDRLLELLAFFAGEAVEWVRTGVTREVGGKVAYLTLVHKIAIEDGVVTAWGRVNMWAIKAVEPYSNVERRFISPPYRANARKLLEYNETIAPYGFDPFVPADCEKFVYDP